MYRRCSVLPTWISSCPDAPFVFGEADRDAGGGLVPQSSRPRSGWKARPLRSVPQAPRAEWSRSTRSAISWASRTAWTPRCAMFLSHKPSDSDRKGPGLCNGCRGALGHLRDECAGMTIASLCQRGGASCGACCGLYNRQDFSRQAVNDLLARAHGCALADGADARGVPGGGEPSACGGGRADFPPGACVPDARLP